MQMAIIINHLHKSVFQTLKKRKTFHYFVDNLQPLHTGLKIVCGHSANHIAALVLVLACILENSISSVANQNTPFVVERPIRGPT